MEFALAHQRPDLANRANNRRIVYVAIMVVFQLIAVTGIGNEIGAAATILLVIAMLVLMAMVLHIIHRVKVELAR